MSEILEEQSYLISSRSDLKRWSFRLFWASPQQQNEQQQQQQTWTKTTRWVAIWDQRL